MNIFFKIFEQLKQVNTYLLPFIFFYFTAFLFSEAQARNQAPTQKSNFQVAYEKATQNKKTSFEFIDKKGRKRMYVIEKNGAINEINSYKNTFSQKDNTKSARPKNRSVTTQSPFQLALDNAKRRGLKNFQFTDQKGKIRTYTISKSGVVNEKISMNDKFSSPKSDVKKLLTPRVFKIEELKTVNVQDPQVEIENQKNYSRQDLSQLSEVKDLENEKNSDQSIGPNKNDDYQRAGDWFMKFFDNYDSYDTSLRVGTRWWQSVGDTTWAKCANASCGGGAGLGVVNVGGLKVAGQNGDPTSKLAWEGQKVLAHEVFIDYSIEGFKFKGILGIKELSKGRGGNIRDWDWVVDTLHDYDLNDTDDWVVGTGETLLYSDTESPLEDLDTNYISLDFGYTFNLADYLPINNVSITPFVGYYEYREKAVAKGIYSHTNDVLKAAGASWTDPTNPSLANTRVLGNEIYWSGPRVGAEIEWQVISNLNLLANIAYADGNVSDDDSHLLREDARGPSPNVFMRADAKGWMVDLLGRYNVNLADYNLPDHKIGIELGYRYWRFDNDGDGIQFYHPIAGFGPFVTREINSSRTGFILGLDYTF